MDNFRIITATLPHRENEVAEIWYQGQCWVEISQEVKDNFVIEFYNHPEDICWNIPYEDAIDMLEKAKNRLLGISRID